MTLDERVAEAQAEGFVIVQRGRVLIPYKEGPGKLSFAERVEGFDIHMMGTFAPPSYRSQFENRLLDDDERWVHLRKPRGR